MAVAGPHWRPVFIIPVNDQVSRHTELLDAQPGSCGVIPANGAANSCHHGAMSPQRRLWILIVDRVTAQPVRKTSLGCIGRFGNPKTTWSGCAKSATAAWNASTESNRHTAAFMFIECRVGTGDSHSQCVCEQLSPVRIALGSVLVTITFADRVAAHQPVEWRFSPSAESCQS